MSGREATFEDFFIKLEDAPEKVGKSKRTIYRWIRDGRIKVIRMDGKKWLMTPDLLDAEVDTRR